MNAAQAPSKLSDFLALRTPSQDGRSQYIKFMEHLLFFGEEMEQAEFAELTRQLAALGPEEALSAYLRPNSTVSLMNEAIKFLDLVDTVSMLQLWEILVAHPLTAHFVQLPLAKQAFDRVLAHQLPSRPHAAATILSLSNAALYRAWQAAQPHPLSAYYAGSVAGLVPLLPDPPALLSVFLSLARCRRAEAFVFGLQFELAEIALAQHVLSPDVTWLTVAGFMWAGGHWDLAEAVASELRAANLLLQGVTTLDAWTGLLGRLGGPGRRLACLLAPRWPGERCFEVAVAAVAELSWLAGHQLARQAQAQRSPHTPYLLSRLSALKLTQPEATPYPWLPVP